MRERGSIGTLLPLQPTAGESRVVNRFARKYSHDVEETRLCRHPADRRERRSHRFVRRQSGSGRAVRHASGIGVFPLSWSSVRMHRLPPNCYRSAHVVHSELAFTKSAQPRPLRRTVEILAHSLAQMTQPDDPCNVRGGHSPHAYPAGLRSETGLAEAGSGRKGGNRGRPMQVTSLSIKPSADSRFKAAVTYCGLHFHTRGRTHPPTGHIPGTIERTRRMAQRSTVAAGVRRLQRAPRATKKRTLCSSRIVRHPSGP